MGKCIVIEVGKKNKKTSQLPFSKNMKHAGKLLDPPMAIGYIWGSTFFSATKKGESHWFCQQSDVMQQFPWT